MNIFSNTENKFYNDKNYYRKNKIFIKYFIV